MSKYNYRGVYIMITFTHILVGFFVLGFSLCLIPRKWYKKCSLDFRILGIWLTIFSIGILASSWILYAMYILGRFLFITYVLTWGFAA